VTTQSKAWVYGRSLAGIAGSNRPGNIDIPLVRVFFVVKYRSLRRADHSSREVLRSVMGPVGMIDKQRMGKP
jgi:hypothetical protein